MGFFLRGYRMKIFAILTLLFLGYLWYLGQEPVVAAKVATPPSAEKQEEDEVKPTRNGRPFRGLGPDFFFSYQTSC